MTIFLEANSTTFQRTSGLYLPSSNAVRGEEASKGNDRIGRNTTRQKIDGTTNKKSTDGAEVPKWRYSPNHDDRQQPGSTKSKKQTSWEHNATITEKTTKGGRHDSQIRTIPGFISAEDDPRFFIEHRDRATCLLAS